MSVPLVRNRQELALLAALVRLRIVHDGQEAEFSAALERILSAERLVSGQTEVKQ